MSQTPYHPPLTIDGTAYAFDHLEPHDLLVESSKAAKELRIHIRYTNHCFTCGFDPAAGHQEAVILPDRSRGLRVFDPIRYTLSKSLPECMERLAHPKTNVRQPTTRRNWLHSISIESDIGPYHIFFELRRAARGERQDLNMTVESAYPQGSYAPPQVLGQISFALLAGKIYCGQPTTTRR